jgi:hypothetical protein
MRLTCQTLNVGQVDEGLERCEQGVGLPVTLLNIQLCNK